jgi:hypothetical protein
MSSSLKKLVINLPITPVINAVKATHCTLLYIAKLVIVTLTASRASPNFLHLTGVGL